MKSTEMSEPLVTSREEGEEEAGTDGPAGVRETA
jgi:hypothetical protein